jgi:hypothetical protein
MIGSRPSRRGSLSLIALLGALASGAPIAAAQTVAPALPAAASAGAPIQLLPAPIEGAEATPGGDAASVVPSGESLTADTRAPTGIQVEPIGRGDGYGGTLDPDDGGLGIDMWQGTDRATAEALLPRLPAPGASPALRGLVRRLLLSAAEAPEGRGDGDLLALRAERLRVLGNVADMKSFVAVLPQRPEDPAIARFRLETAWLSNDFDAACAEVAALLPQFADAIDLQEGQVFCQASSGQVKESQLGAGLLREQGVKDATFFALLDAIDGYKGVRLPADAPPSALALAMAEKAGVAPLAAWTATDDPAILARLATDGALPIEARLDAGERAFAMGSLDADGLAAIYRAVPADPATLDDLLGLEDAALPPSSRALFYQAIRRAQQTAEKARLLHRALELARAEGGYPAAVATEMDALLELAPSADLAWFAADAGRAVYLAGRYERAGAWETVARLRAPDDRDAAAAVRTLALLAQVAGGDEPLAWAPDAVDQWQAAQEAAGDTDAADRAARLFAVLAALGEPVGDRWSQLAGEPLADPALRGQLAAAAAAGRRAETVALAAILLGPNGPAAANPVLVNEALTALGQVGLGDEARALALETVIASGI